MSRGFTLIELVIYMTIFSGLGLLVFSWHSMIGSFFMTQSRYERMIIEEDVALDVIRRDIMCACRSSSTWDEDAFVFAKEVLNGESYAVGFSVRENTLYRYNGAYDFATKRWIRKTTQILATGMSAVKMRTYRLHDSVHRVMVFVHHMGSQKPISIHVLLRNRVL